MIWAFFLFISFFCSVLQCFLLELFTNTSWPITKVSSNSIVQKKCLQRMFSSSFSAMSNTIIYIQAQRVIGWRSNSSVYFILSESRYRGGWAFCSRSLNKENQENSWNQEKWDVKYRSVLLLLAQEIGMLMSYIALFLLVYSLIYF